MNKLKTLTTSNYSTTFATNLIILVSGLINSIILARLLGPEKRGEVAAAILWPTLWVYLGSFGLTEATLYFAAQEPESINTIYTSSLVFTLILCLLVIPVAYLVLPVVLAAQSAQVIELSSGFLVFIPFGMLLGHHASILRSQLRINAFNLLTMVIPVGNTVGAIILGFTHHLSLPSVIAIHLLLGILGVLVSLSYIFKQGILTRLNLQVSTMRKMISYGIRVHIGTLFSLANLRLDQILLAGWTTPEKLGLYVVAVKVASIASVLTPIVTTIAVPKIARHIEVELRIKELTHIFQHFWLLSVLAKVSFALIVPIILPLLYGVQFSPAIVAIEILILGSLFLDTKTLLTGGAQALNSPWLASWSEIVASVSTCVFLLILLPSFGIDGAAITSLIAYGMALLVTLRGLKSQHGIRASSLFQINEDTRSTLMNFSARKFLNIQ